MSKDALYCRVLELRWIRKPTWTKSGSEEKLLDDGWTKLELSTYDKTLERCGVLVLFGITENSDESKERLAIGWSLCQDDDQFNRAKAVNIAQDRACKLYRENPDRELFDVELNKLPKVLRKWVIRTTYELLADYRIKEYVEK